MTTTENVFPGIALSLLAGAGGGTRRPSPAVLRAAEAAIDLLREARIDSLYYLAAQPDAPAQRVYDKIAEAQRKAARSLLERFDAEGTRCVTFKSAEFGARYFERRAVNFSYDVDLLVRREDVQKAKIVLYGAGFRQGEQDTETHQVQDADVLEIAELEGDHYELYPFNKVIDLEVTRDEAAFVRGWGKRIAWMEGDSCRLLVQVDIHHNVATDIDPKPLFERCERSALGAGWTLSAADHLWFTTSRYYNEVAIHDKNQLRDFAYLVAHTARADIDWDVVREVAATYGLNASLYYYLSFINDLVGGRVPDAVLRALSPDQGPRHKDWGWQLAKLFHVVDPNPLAQWMSTL